MASSFDDLPVLEDEDLIRFLHCLEPVSDHDDRLPSKEIVERFRNRLLGDRVQS